VSSKQGGAVARGLLERGHKVRAVTRDPDSSQAKALANAGATLVAASLEDTAAITKALEGATSLFAMKWRARMKAVRVLEYGGQLVFGDVPTPTIARDEILVKIKSTAVNHLDLVEASGTFRPILPIDLPWIPGHEFSGVVEQSGSDVAAFAPGDAVFGTSGGAYAEYLVVKPAAVVRKPSNLSFEEAASVPVASQTAWQGLFTHGHLEKGQTILIHGGAGAVGAYAVQLASHAGATVIATARRSGHVTCGDAHGVPLIDLSAQTQL
jgi:NADPH:quinone reductase-like Zn-dependent oxidoreductase